MKKLLILILTIVLLIFTWKQYRHFYQVGDVTFTVWKRPGGYCYITPYRYWGLSIPKENYIKAANLGEVNFYIDKNSTLLIYNYYVHIGRNNCIECHFDKYNYKQFELSSTASEEDIKLWETKRRDLRDRLPFFEIDIKWMNAEIGNIPK